MLWLQGWWQVAIKRQLTVNSLFDQRVAIVYFIQLPPPYEKVVKYSGKSQDGESHMQFTNQDKKCFKCGQVEGKFRFAISIGRWFSRRLKRSCLFLFLFATRVIVLKVLLKLSIYKLKDSFWCDWCNSEFTYWMWIYFFFTHYSSNCIGKVGQIPRRGQMVLR